MQISLVSWNVNGIRAVSAKDEFKEWFAQDKYDVISMQETKASVDQIPEHNQSILQVKMAIAPTLPHL